MQIQRAELYGRVLRKIDLPHFLVTETRYEPGMHLPVHSHNHSYISFVLQGAYREMRDHVAEDCSTGSLIFHPSDEVHTSVFHSGESRCLNLHLTFSESGIRGDFSRRIHSKNRIAGGITSKIYRELCDPDSLSELILDGLAFELLGETLRLGHSREKIPAWLKQTEDFIHSSFQEHLTIADLARVAAVHPVHLSRSFRKAYRCTIGEFLRRIRIEFACRKLCTSELELIDIALQSGFSDQSAFAKTFKRVTGYTPAQFRKTFRSR